MIKILNYILWFFGKLERRTIISFHSGIPEAEEQEIINNRFKEKFGRENILISFDDLRMPMTIEHIYFKK